MAGLFNMLRYDVNPLGGEELSQLLIGSLHYHRHQLLDK